ncbi:pseudouridine synthase [Streptococcus pseudoporcinus]|uniref:pseudouridine synthase n=1 Tax=Streptococcus pseudoporcinus TaxID=361101 RepID=UPI0009852565|nr:pseudouridine synthase [Streptococcus pseudoporcinus]VUC68041.1 ribosomal small subunit pseudouridine synthase B [Streptococcus pseudoporcinus]VUC98953.1 ribosomal small subunit pseudouridine synthase B [Streptococcus pseudoporcinus]VUC99345.1 ribosomal small subunit pseudouridine synthase B [Streptococcus pseudoporcinus]
MRLDKFLAEAGFGSRSQVKSLLKTKKVCVNGKNESQAKKQINPNLDRVEVEGQEVLYEEFVYYMLNKPKGVVSATQDKVHQTVLDLLDATAKQKAVFPVGRLDKDTHGLLLLTNNGDLAHRLLSPKKHVNKVYVAEVDGLMTSQDIEAFEKGIQLSDHQCQPAVLEILASDRDKSQSRVKIVIKEGKFHQVKRMVLACGKEVRDLQRLEMGPLQLDSTLDLGAFRKLEKSEIDALLNLP